ncbi:MAG TPA: hypothetical protein VGH74_20805 [Planctomycetaceae bacterium]|jgi:hypothetical protein
MSQRIFVSLLMAAFPLCGGIWATLVGFEYIGKLTGAELNPRYAIRRRLYRLGGPIVIVMGLWVAVQPIVAPLHGVKWETFAPAGFGFSIEMPGRPEETSIEETGEYGPVTNHLARVQLPSLGTTSLVQYTPLPDAFPRLTAGQRQELLKEQVAKLVEKSEGELVDDEKVTLAGRAGIGRQFRIKLNKDLIYRGQFWFLGRTRFQLTVVGPRDLIDTAISRRFFDSFSYPAPPPEVPADPKPEQKETDPK